VFKNYEHATVAAIDPRRCSIGRHRKRKILLLSRHAGQAAPAGSRFDQVPATCLTDFFTFLSSFFASFQSGLKDSRDFIALEFQASVVGHQLFGVLENISRTPAASENS
jgi:hypothetical protein